MNGSSAATGSKRSHENGHARPPPLTVGTAVLCKAPGTGGNGWYGGTVIGPGLEPESDDAETYRVVFMDGTIAPTVRRCDAVLWGGKPEERIWHKRHKFFDRSRRPETHAMNRTVEQLDPTTLEAMSRWPTARRACEAFTWIPDPADIVACCRGQIPQAGGYKWRFTETGARVDANDVDELLSVNAEIIVQKVNPKRAPSKSHDLYELYKTANTVREMLALGGRRGDVSYDIAHGWIKFKDPDLARRFTPAAKQGPHTAPEPAATATTVDDDDDDGDDGTEASQDRQGDADDERDLDDADDDDAADDDDDENYLEDDDDDERDHEDGEPDEGRDEDDDDDDDENHQDHDEMNGHDENYQDQENGDENGHDENYLDHEENGHYENYQEHEGDDDDDDDENGHEEIGHDENGHDQLEYADHDQDQLEYPDQDQLEYPDGDEAQLESSDHDQIENLGAEDLGEEDLGEEDLGAEDLAEDDGRDPRNQNDQGPSSREDGASSAGTL